MRDEILQAAMKHGNAAFNQGYEAARKGITIDNFAVISAMEEAGIRLAAFEELANRCVNIFVIVELLEQYYSRWEPSQLLSQIAELLFFEKTHEEITG